MDEKDLLVLEGLGYKVNKLGAIVDKNNNFIDKVEHNGRVIQTHVTAQEFAQDKQKKSYLDNIGFKYNPSKGGTQETQESIAVAKEQLKQYEKNPLNIKLPLVDSDPIYKEAFEELKKEKEEKGQFSFQSPTAMTSSLEEGTVYEEIQDQEKKNSLKDIETRLKKIQEIDPDVDTILKGTVNEERSPDRNIFEKGGDMLWDGIYSALSSFTPTGKGMNDDKLKEEYLNLKQQKKDILIPVAENKLKDVNTLLEQLTQEIEQVGYFDNAGGDYDRYAFAINNLEDKKRNLEDYINGDSLDSNIFTLNNASDWASLGLYNTYANFKYVNKIREKLEAGEGLTKAEEAVFKSKAMIDDVNKNNFEQNFWHEVSQGTNDSVKFLGFGVAGRVAGRAVAKGTGKILTGTANKIIGNAGNLITQTALHPHTYKNAFERYSGDFEIRTEENGKETLLAGERLYGTLLQENKNYREGLEESLNQAKASGDKEEIDKIKKEIFKSEEYAKSLKKPVNYGNALAYGFTEMLKENTAEVFGGKVYKALGLKKLESSLLSNRLGKKLLGNKLLNPVNKVLGGTPSQKIIGSNTEEIFEEILVQATPTYGQTWEEYKDQVSELTKADFYAKVAAQTLLMNKGFQAGGLAKKYYDIQRLTPEVKEQRKKMSELYKELGNRNLSQEDFNESMMKAGVGNFTTQEYANTINNLRSKGRVEEANNIEQNKIYKQALAAQKMGKLSDFRKALNSAQYNKNLDSNTLANIALAKVEVDEILDDENNFINSNEVINLKSTKKFTERSKKEVETELFKLEDQQLTEQFETFLKQNDVFSEETSIKDFIESKKGKELVDYGFKSLPKQLQSYVTLANQKQNLDTSLSKIEKTLNKVTSYDHQIKLEIEQDYFNYLDGLNKKLFNRNISSQQFQNLVEKIPSKKQKGISKDRLKEIHEQTYNTLLVKEESQQDSNSTIKEDKIEENKEEVPVQQDSQKEFTPEETEAFKNPESQEEINKNTEKILLEHLFSTTQQAEEQNSTDDEIDFLPSENLVSQFSDWGARYKEDFEIEPTFEEFFKDALKIVEGDKSAFRKKDIKNFGEAWESAGLGKSNWEQIYKDNYSDLNQITRNIVSSIINQEVESNQDSVNEVIEQKQIEKVETPVGINPQTGEPIKVTPVAGKTTIVTPKANFSALEYINTNKVITLPDGKKGITYTKEDTKEIPVLREESFIDVRSLLHPNKNNPGDNWNIKISDEADWGDPNLKVSVNQTNTGEPIQFISFTDWIKRNKPESQSLEDFSKTEAFINKVPIYYVDKEGNNVSFVADVDWYNPLSVRDTSKSVGDFVDLNSLTDTHKRLIQEGKDNTINLRKSIVSGNIKQVQIVSKEGSPFIKLPKTDSNNNPIPTKTLKEASPDSKIVFFKGDYFVDLKGNPIDLNKIEISNLDTLRKEASKGKTNSTFYLSPINKTDSKERFLAINVLRKNEEGIDRAYSEDVETSKLILAANSVLLKNKTLYGITINDAQSIKNQILQVTGLDISNYDSANNLVSSLIALQKENKKYVAGDKNIPLEGREGYFIDALFYGDYTPVQNTNLSPRKSFGLNIQKSEQGNYTVNKIGETYEDFLKQRLSTNIISYNMGTEDSPAYTHSVQPIIKVEPIVIEKPSINKVEINNTDNIEDSIDNALDFLGSINGLDDFDSDYLLPVLEEVGSIKDSLNIIEGLTLDQQNDVVNFLLSTVSKNYKDSKTLSVKEFSNKIKESFDNYFNPLKTKLEKIEGNLLPLLEQSPDNEKLRNTIKGVQNNLSHVNSVINNYEKLFSKAYLEGMRKGLIPSNIKTSQDLQEELKEHFEEEMYDKDYSKSSNEIIHKDKVSKKLRRLFSTITNGKTGFLGTPKFDGYDLMYNTISTLLTSPLPASPSFDSMIQRLEQFKGSYPWLNSLIVDLSKTDSDVKDSFVSNMYKYAAKAKFVAFTDQTNGIDSRLWDSNSNDIKLKIREHWNNNFKRSTITNNNLLNPTKLESLYQQWESWGENKENQPDSVLKIWLEDFGIKLSDNTWKDLKDGKLVTGKGPKARNLTFQDLFFDSGKRSDRLFSNLANFAKEAKNLKKEDLDFVQNNKVHPYDDMSEIIKSLLELESKHNTHLINITRRDGDKTVSEIIFPTFFLNNVDKLVQDANTEDKTYIKDLKSTSFSKSSLVLDLLENYPEFANIFEYGEVGLMSMKRLYKAKPSFAKIDQISPIDYMFHQRTMFQNTRTEKFDVNKDSFELRVATVSTPTNSDKGRMMLLKTAVYDLFSSVTAFKKEENSTYSFSNELKEVLYNRLVLPELERIVNHKETNIKAYDKGAKRFNLLPVLNTLINSKNQTTLEYLKNNKNLESFKEQYFESITSFIEDNIKEEANSNLKILESFVTSDKDTSLDLFNNKDYLAKRKTKESVNDKMLLAEYDYIINGMIANMNTMQTISGDPAVYFKSKGSINSIDVSEQNQISKDLGTNLGKRLALMIAPGVVLANSKNEKYLQLFLEDQEEVASNAEEIISWHYGRKSLSEEYNGKTYKQHLTDLRNKNISKSDLGQLKLRFQSVKDFLEIESTDAQEYTTLREHLRVLEGLGRLSLEKKNSIIDKVYNKKEPLSKEEVNVVLQPIKPVYTGDVLDKKQDVRRIVYIKSSSFPLIPDLVNGTKLEPLMKKMESLENSYGTTVRASYQSANKVGAMTETINPFNEESLSSIEELDSNTGLPTKALQLDRINFKIQQDVPFKSDLQLEDKVSMGTQIFKLLFGDGITEINNFKLGEENLSGEELKQRFFQSFSNIVNLQKDALLNELGLDENYNSENKEESAKKLQKLLVAEAEERGFSENDIKSLEIQKKSIKGQEVYHFKLPLWFSGNSNKIESMFNAIINNRIFKQKLPGNSFVVGSEAGFSLQTQDQKASNNVIYVGNYRGEELKGNEVLAPSKFKINGKLVNLFEKDSTGEYKYIVQEKGQSILRKDKIDSKLLENFVFRTPTSSHGSASSIKIVGILPTIMGDLMITPKNFVTQMGQDFDIDKLTAYQYHTINMPDGSIRILNESNREEFIADTLQKIRDLKSEIETEGEYGESTDKLVKATFGDLEISSEDIRNSLNKDLSKLKQKLNQNFDLKIEQNNFIDIHNAVYQNTDSKVQKKINKVLSMEFAENQAEAIDALNSESSNETFNILSPKYQMNKMIAGSTGALAIGIYAKGVTFNSLAQQANDPIILTTTNENFEVVDKTINIGKLYSKGQFGLEKALSKPQANEVEKSLTRFITQVQDERVNTGTDNEKAQILGRVGITHLDAVAVDNLLSLLGIDAEINQINSSEYDSSNPFHKNAVIEGKEVFYTEYSIPYLLHSQPIVKEYFERIKNGSAIVQQFSGDVSGLVKNSLLSGYETKVNYTQNFTGENLVEEIKAGNYESDFQKEILTLYLDLIKDAKKLKELQDVTDMSNLGKSMWALKDKIEAFKNLPNNADFKNADKELLGNFDSNASEIYLGDKRNFDPKTPQGAMIGTALSLGRNLFFEYFPYYNSYITEKVAQIEASSGFRGNPVKLKEVVFQEIKKYVTSATRNNLFLDTPSKERASIFIDTDSNTSLSSYVADQFNTNNKDFKKGQNLIKNNSFLSFLSYEKGEKGKPSLIKFDNSNISNVSEEHHYLAFKELFIKDYPLPPRNGESYSTRKLAQELVAYSYLSGGVVSEAVEFHKFIPIEYYDELYSERLGVNVTRMLQNYDTTLTNWGDKDRLKNFNKQFFQNNPEYAKQYSASFRSDFFEYDGTNLIINADVDYPAYVSVKIPTKEKLKQDKWKLYEQVSHNSYKEIGVLGEFGMAEYDYDSSDVKSVINKPVDQDRNILARSIANMPGVDQRGFTISNGESTKEILENIKSNNISYNPSLSDIADNLLKVFKEDSLNSVVKVINDSSMPFSGRYRDNVITINTANSPRIAETFVHEFIHSVTVNNLKQYYNKDWKTLSSEVTAPKEIIDLNLLFNDYKEEISKKFPEELKEFNKKYESYKQNKPVNFTKRELSVFYPIVNIKEFLAVSLSNNKELIEVTSQIPYKKSELTIREKFIELLDKILNSIVGVKNNFAEKILSTNLSAVEAINKSVNQEVNPSDVIDIIRKESTEDNSIEDQDISNLPDNIKPCD